MTKLGTASRRPPQKRAPSPSGRDAAPATAPMDVEEAVRLRRSISRLLRRLMAAATDEGLTPTEASVLGSISSKGPIGVAQLVALEHINKTLLSRVVRRLIELGLAERRQDPQDLRAALFDATTAGRRIHERVKAQRAQLILDGVAALGDADRAALTEALGALESLAEAIRAAP